MVALNNSASSDALTPGSPIRDTTRATLDARAALDAQDMQEALDPSDHMVDVFDSRPSSNPSAIKSVADLEDTSGDQTDHTPEQIEYGQVSTTGNATSCHHITVASNTPEHGEHGGRPSQREHTENIRQKEPQDPTTQSVCVMENENSDQPHMSTEQPQPDKKDDEIEPMEQNEHADHQAPPHSSNWKQETNPGHLLQPHDPSESPHQSHPLDHHPKTLGDISKDKITSAESVACARSAAAAATAVANAAANAAITASAAALAAAGVSSTVATSTVPALHIPPCMPTAATTYPSFTPLAPNGAPLMAHPLVTLPMQIGRRAVRIAPMGVLPLPPQGTVTGALVAADMAVGANADGRGAMEVNLGSVGGRGTIGEMPKGKRRGVTGGGNVSTEGMTAEERTKQRRMLRNRESAARSRDKRKTRNMQLEASITQYRKKMEVMEKLMDELQDTVDAMEQVLKKHKVAMPC